jgi:ketosteroid isomerase-like protein
VSRNLENVQRVFAAFLGADARALFEVIAEDAVWHVGRDEVFELFRATRRLTEGTYRSELRWALADEEHAVAVYRAGGTRPDGRTLDIDQVLLIELRDERWQHVTAVPTEPEAFEAFWA